MKEKIHKNSESAEMGFFDHIEVLRWHIMRSTIAILIATIVAFLNKKIIFDFIIFGPTRSDFPTNRFFCWLSNQSILFKGLCVEGVKYNFINTDIAGQFMLHIKTSFLVGFLMAFPYIFWEFWRFVKPALNDSEIKSSGFIVFFTSILFGFGCLFSYFIIVPFSINFLYTYVAIETAQNMIEISNYLSIVVTMVLPVGIVFELPMMVYFLTRIGLITPTFMKESRKIAYVAILFIVAVITPQGDIFSLLLISGPIILLYEGSIFISHRVHSRIVKEELNY